jgi:hypothetical protein
MATDYWSEGSPGPNTPEILAALEKWTGAVINIRQVDYDATNNTRLCEADFEYQNTPPANLLMPLLFGTDPSCARAARYKIQPLLDQPGRFYVSWICLD